MKDLQTKKWRQMLLAITCILLMQTALVQAQTSQVKTDTIRLRYGMGTALLIAKKPVYDWLSNKIDYHLEIPKDASGASIGVVMLQPKVANPVPATLTLSIPEDDLTLSFVLMVERGNSLIQQQYDFRQPKPTRIQQLRQAKTLRAATPLPVADISSAALGWKQHAQQLLKTRRRIKSLGIIQHKMFLAVEDIRVLPSQKALALRLRFKNKGNIPYHIEVLTLERSQNKAGADISNYQVEGIEPLFTPSRFRVGQVIAAKQTIEGVFIIPQFAPDEDTVYKLVIREKEGQRRMALEIPHEFFLAAKTLKL
jgi:hypothetical protein